MHPTALSWGERLLQTYDQPAAQTVIDVGAQDVNGSLKTVCPPKNRYIGVDFVKGKGVDVVLQDPYRLPFDDGHADVVISSSVFEHSEMFWLLFSEILRVLKPAGLFYLNVPSNGFFHRYPVDCWRFYPDSGRALVTWAARNGYDPLLLESFIGAQQKDLWNDFVAVFLRDRKFAAKHPKRILDSTPRATNAFRAGSDKLINPRQLTEDQQRRKLILQIASGTTKPERS